MSIRISLNHRTEYRYDRSVGLSAQVVRLRPAPHCLTPIEAYSLKIEPDKHFINWQQDPFGNHLARLVFPDKTRRLTVEVNLVASLSAANPFDFFLEPSAKEYPFDYAPDLLRDLGPYLETKEKSPRLEAWVKKVDRRPRSTVDFLVEQNQRVTQQIGYVTRMEHGVQSCEHTLKSRLGSCRDSAWLFVQILRRLGIAARFCSGYLIQLTEDLPPLDGPPGPVEDFTDLHAWTEVYLPGAGWVGLDTTSGLLAGEGHIPLACTPEPTTAAPVTGATEPCEVEFFYHNEVTRLREDPRVTKPYTDTQWQQVLDLGQSIDQRLNEGDVRLTLGGEPTFVSIDDMEDPQWTTEALGDDKEVLADRLLRRLAQRFGPGAALLFGQGKWYPGEPLPRWAYTAVWRCDQVPVWDEPSLLADPTVSGDCDLERARRFGKRLTRQLGLSADYLVPAYEDALYYLWKEQNLPANVDPFDNRLDDPLERERLARILDGELGIAAGYVLPIAAEENGAGFKSDHWQLRRDRLLLLPGDSALGFRLPLDSLEWEPDDDRQNPLAMDPFAIPPRFSDTVGAPPPAALPPRPADQDNEPLIRTALCIEPRGGVLRIFLPPLTRAEDFLELLTHVESVARELSQPVLLEGYPPPRDHRLIELKVTPDPGVIEVNVQPAASWQELVENTETLYDEARSTRLGTEKFMIDGRHCGTGGGNHVTVGGRTPADSPLLRRPELLASLVLYWQHHPSLSYLFSGLFIGPTSQAPRLDEARDDMLHELDIAVSQLPTGEVATPWLTDRLFRNLLVDITGNTHRAEFCVDKLYAPEGPAGRQGLLEFRGFEMPPHAQMSLVQMLLLRALIAVFWEQPFLRPARRWGTALHDRFMLPHFVWEDFRSVLNDLRAHGLDFPDEWFAPFFEFRFPRFGGVDSNMLSLELRSALEPWHVLGEELAAHSTARYVDSSVERLQVRVTGFDPGRYVVACNRRRVPLIPTTRPGELVGGVRFKAWQPASGLHPTIPAESPLTFEIIDTWNSAAVTGCTYHVSHPGGRSYDTMPVNAAEADARRRTRFWPFGHSTSTVEVPPEESQSEHPCTLDLRSR